MNDKEVVDAFVAHLRNHGHAGLGVDLRPDEENRRSPDIDAIAGPFAIEHTSIDTLPEQRRDSDWFMQAVGGLEQEFSSLPFHLYITLEYGAVRKGQNWKDIRKALKTWLTNETQRLPSGRSVFTDLPGIPFPLHVSKSEQLRPGIFFARFEPKDETLPARVREVFDKKSAKLAKYQAEFATILLLESNDISLMNAGKMQEAISDAYPNGLPGSVHEVWFADTSIPNELQFQNFTPQLQSIA